MSAAQPIVAGASGQRIVTGCCTRVIVTPEIVRALAAVDVLSGLGFFFAGLLPEYRNGDVLRLQRLSPRAAAGPLPVLATEGAKELGDVVARDRARLRNTPCSGDM